MSAGVVLTALYVPGDRPSRFDTAVASGADVVILDLEDAVAPAAKADARRAVDGWLGNRATAGGSPTIQVRVNPLGSPWTSADLAMLAAHATSMAVRLPKVTHPGDLDAVATTIAGARVHALVETALGVEHAYAIALHPAVATIGLGDADLASDLGLSEDAGLDWARSRVVIAARAASRPPPMMAAYTRINDIEGLVASCRAGRALGFIGRTAVHPSQLRHIVKAFRPSDPDVDRARSVVDAVDAAHTDGVGVSVLPSGEMLDAAMLGRARAVLDLARCAADALAAIERR